MDGEVLRVHLFVHVVLVAGNSQRLKHSLNELDSDAMEVGFKTAALDAADEKCLGRAMQTASDLN